MQDKEKSWGTAMRDAYGTPAPKHKLHMLGEAGFFHPLNWMWRMKLLNQLLNVLFYFAVFGALGWLASQALDRNHPVHVDMKPLNTVVRPGEELKFEMTINRYRACASDVSWIIFDGQNEARVFGPKHYEVMSENLGVQPSYVRGYKVPDYVTPGRGRLRILRSFSCPGNYLHEWKPIAWAEPDIKFTILNKDGSVPDLTPDTEKITEEEAPKPLTAPRFRSPESGGDSGSGVSGP